MLDKNKKMILLLLVAAIIAYFLFFRKKTEKKTAEETIKEGVASTLSRSATESLSAVQMSDEDEEYNLLRQEYSDRYGEAAKNSWTKAMIQQKIDEYDARSKYLDMLAEISGEDKLEDASTMNSEEILRLIETEKQRIAKELESARVAYKAATGKDADSTLNSYGIYAAIANELAKAQQEYTNFTGEKAPASCTTAVKVREALTNKKKQMRDEWNSRKNHILTKASLVADKLKVRAVAKGELETAFKEVYYYNERDFYVWFENCYAMALNENRGLLDELKDINTSILYGGDLKILAGAIISRRQTNYKLGLRIDEYGRVTN